MWDPFRVVDGKILCPQCGGEGSSFCRSCEGECEVPNDSLIARWARIHLDPDTVFDEGERAKLHETLIADHGYRAEELSEIAAGE